MSTYDCSVLRTKLERIRQEGRTGFTECLHIVEQINADIQLTEVSLRNAQERLTKLQRSLKVYQKYQIKDETE